MMKIAENPSWSYGDTIVLVSFIVSVIGLILGCISNRKTFNLWKESTKAFEKSVRSTVEMANNSDEKLLNQKELVSMKAIEEFEPIWKLYKESTKVNNPKERYRVGKKLLQAYSRWRGYLIYDLASNKVIYNSTTLAGCNIM